MTHAVRIVVEYAILCLQCHKCQHNLSNIRMLCSSPMQTDDLSKLIISVQQKLPARLFVADVIVVKDS